jgi:hypothetical protein
MRDLGPGAFVGLTVAFTACLAASGAASVLAHLLRQRGRPTPARTWARWASGLGAAAAGCLLGAGILFTYLSR